MNTATIANLIQLAILVAIVIYAWDTRHIRQSAQEQAEALQKPFVTLWTELREPNDAILEMDGAIGSLIIGSADGDLVLHNQGSGPALNVTYRFTPINPQPGANVPHPSSYLPSIPAGAKVSIPVPRAMIATVDYKCSISFESLSGQQYENTITVTSRVLTASAFAKRAIKMKATAYLNTVLLLAVLAVLVRIATRPVKQPHNYVYVRHVPAESDQTHSYDPYDIVLDTTTGKICEVHAEGATDVQYRKDANGKQNNEVSQVGGVSCTKGAE